MSDATLRPRSGARRDGHPLHPGGQAPATGTGANGRRVGAERSGGAISPRGARLLQLAIVLAIAAALALAYLLSPWARAEVGGFVEVAGRGDAAAIGERLRSYGAWAPVVSLGLMVAQALVAPVPAFLVVFANGLAFGIGWGWLLSLIGQVLAAAVCFWLARVLGRSSVESLVGRLGLESADRWFARWGIVGLFLTRLVPGVGFDAVSYAAGLTRMGFGRFTAVTIAGSGPQLLLYVVLGRRAPGSIWLLVAATAVVAGAVGVVALVRRRRRWGEHPGVGRAVVQGVEPDRDRSVA